MRKLLALVCFAASMLVFATSATAGGGSALFPPNSTLGDLTYSEWQGAYQIWLNEIPKRVNPIDHPNSGHNCALENGVVFLGPAGADCTIPADTPAAFTLAVGFWECSTAEGIGETFEQLRRRCERNFDRDLDPSVYHQVILIDGELVRGDRRWISVSPGEIIDFPEENIWDAEPGPSKSVTKGFLFILRPLSAGTHTIRARIRDENIGKFRYVWKLDVVS